MNRWARSPRCVSLARRELRQVLAEWDLTGLTDAAELVVSELLTNAVRHVRAPQDRLVETRYERLAGGVRIEVHDADETRPVVREASMDAESGRGLALVDALTGGCWGVSGREGVGKLVWAVVADDGHEDRPGSGPCGEQGL
ncbi:ATP-binding protein [Streptomyces sp. NBC_01190]|uniref:ATP-binding protein n=1 Tax=Streptomyces sp. NBC_01190 TaxID=2903767 RepID=UPI003869BC8E|nr:ATP-binding protein [Streptomyces sp. NBC_01190]